METCIKLYLWSASWAAFIIMGVRASSGVDYPDWIWILVSLCLGISIVLMADVIDQILKRGDGR